MKRNIRAVVGVIILGLALTLLIASILGNGFDYYGRMPSEREVAAVWGPCANSEEFARIATSNSNVFPRCAEDSDEILHTLESSIFLHNLDGSQLVFNETLGLYAYEQSRVVVWSFWDGVNMPAYIKLSILTWLCHNNDAGYVVAVLDTDTAERLLGGFHPVFPYLKMAHKADYLRAYLLHKFGGVWLDADTLAMASAGGQISYLRENLDVLGYSWEPQDTQIGFGVMGPMKAGNLLTKAWVQALKIKLDDNKIVIAKKKRDTFEWTEILGDIVMPIHEQLLSMDTFRYKAVPGPWNYGQLVLLFTGDLFGPCSSTILPPFNTTPYLMYHNSHVPMTSPLRKMTVADFVQGKTVFGKMVWQSLRRCQSNRGNLLPCAFEKVLRYFERVYADC